MGGGAQAMKRIPLIKFPRRHPKFSSSGSYVPSSGHLKCVSIVPPACYAQLAASQVYMELELQDNGLSGGGTGHSGEGTRAAGETGVRPLPDLKEKVKGVMFYC